MGLDEVQYGHHNGPCLTSMRTGVSVTISDLASDDRWGAHRLDALAHGIASALSIPLTAGPEVRGALNFYARQLRCSPPNGNTEPKASARKHPWRFAWQYD